LIGGPDFDVVNCPEMTNGTPDEAGAVPPEAIDKVVTGDMA
jgi:hypothetical protein